MATHRPTLSPGLGAKSIVLTIALYVASIGVGAGSLADASVLPYGSILVLVVFAASVLRRGKILITGAERSSDEFEARLAAVSRELETRHLRLQAIEIAQAIAIERQRLMREMHDGLGSSLMSSLVMVEQGKLDASQVACLLRESIDDLELTIDALEPTGDDLETLLGTLRYRLGKRLEAAGIRLEWQVAETPALSWLDPASTLQVLRMLQEALTNVLKHARASSVRVETGFDAQRVWIRLTDNGRGFDVDAVRKSPDRGRGIQNLERRAAALRGAVRIDSRPGATVVTVSMPRGIRPGS